MTRKRRQPVFWFDVSFLFGFSLIREVWIIQLIEYKPWRFKNYRELEHNIWSPVLYLINLSPHNLDYKWRYNYNLEYKVCPILCVFNSFLTFLVDKKTCKLIKFKKCRVFYWFENEKLFGRQLLSDNTGSFKSGLNSRVTQKSNVLNSIFKRQLQLYYVTR